MKPITSSVSNSYLVFPYSSSSSSSKIIIVAQKNKNHNHNNSQSPSKGSDPPPARITSNVKQNLQFLKLWKEYQKRKSGAPRPATSYGRKKVEKDDLLDDDTNLYRDPTLTLYYTNQGIDTAVPVLLVDGYNVCGYWPKLKKHFMGGRLDLARQKLVDELDGKGPIMLIRPGKLFPGSVEAFSPVLSAEYFFYSFDPAEVKHKLINLYMHKWSKLPPVKVKVAVVFDAMMSGLPMHKETFAGVDIVYSTETCADAWIEKEVAALRDDGCPRVWVVTSDRCQQDAAHGAGAFVWSAKALVSEIKTSQKEVERMLQEHKSTSVQGRLLKHNLDTEVVNALKNLRNKLSETESPG